MHLPRLKIIAEVAGEAFGPAWAGWKACAIFGGEVIQDTIWRM